jgi:hypothetical protein
MMTYSTKTKTVVLDGRLSHQYTHGDMDSVHWLDTELINANYWSRLGVDLDFDPLFCEYLNLTCELQKSYPAPSDLPMQPKNMPYYHGPCFQTPTADMVTANTLRIQGLLTDVVMPTRWGQTYLSNVPPQFGEMTSSVHAVPNSRTLLNSEVVQYAHQAMHFNWAVYSFSNGHFSLSIESQGMPFTICLACNTTESGLSLFHEFANNAAVFNSGHDLLNHIRASGDQSIIHGYLIGSYRFRTSAVTLLFWKIQLSIVAQLCLI